MLNVAVLSFTMLSVVTLNVVARSIGEHSNSIRYEVINLDRSIEQKEKITQYIQRLANYFSCSSLIDRN